MCRPSDSSSPSTKVKDPLNETATPCYPFTFGAVLRASLNTRSDSTRTCITSHTNNSLPWGRGGKRGAVTPPRSSDACGRGRRRGAVRSQGCSRATSEISFTRLCRALGILFTRLCRALGDTQAKTFTAWYGARHMGHFRCVTLGSHCEHMTLCPHGFRTRSATLSIHTTHLSACSSI